MYILKILFKRLCLVLNVCVCVCMFVFYLIIYPILFIYYLWYIYTGIVVSV